MMMMIMVLSRIQGNKETSNKKKWMGKIESIIVETTTTSEERTCHHCIINLLYVLYECVSLINRVVYFNRNVLAPWWASEINVRQKLLQPLDIGLSYHDGNKHDSYLSLYTFQPVNIILYYYSRSEQLCSTLIKLKERRCFFYIFIILMNHHIAPIQ